MIEGVFSIEEAIAAHAEQSDLVAAKYKPSTKFKLGPSELLQLGTTLMPAAEMEPRLKVV